MDALGSNTFYNTIIAGNAGSIDIAYYINDPYKGSNNMITGNPMLAPLGDYGGPTLTMMPLSGSPVIGAGTTNGAPTTDQARIQPIRLYRSRRLPDPGFLESARKYDR